MERLPSFSNLIPKSPGPWPGLVFDNWKSVDQEQKANEQEQPPSKPRRQPTEHKTSLETSMARHAHHCRKVSMDSIPSFFDPTVIMNYRITGEPAPSTKIPSPLRHDGHRRKLSIEDIFYLEEQSVKPWTPSRDRTLSCVSALSEGSYWMDDETELGEPQEYLQDVASVTLSKKSSCHTFADYTPSSTRRSHQRGQSGVSELSLDDCSGYDEDTYELSKYGADDTLLEDEETTIDSRALF